MSKKYQIKINEKDLMWDDPPEELENGTLISLGDQNFYFVLPKTA